MRVFLLLMLTLACLGCGSNRRDDEIRDLAALQGNWSSIDSYGSTDEIEIKGDKLFVKRAVVQMSQITLDVSTTPKRFELNCHGSMKEGKIEPARGIYEIHDGLLKVCFDVLKPSQYPTKYDPENTWIFTRQKNAGK